MQSLKGFSTYTKSVLSSSDTFAIRSNTIALGIDENVLVESAGLALANALKRRYREKKVLFVCGSGGKGAIGLSAARHMFTFADVRVVFLGDSEHIHKHTTRSNYNILADLMQVDVVDDSGIAELEKQIRDSDMVIDAIIGAGLKGRLSGFLSIVIKAINAGRRRVIAIDMPSGIDPDTGTTNKIRIRCDELFVLHKPKAGVVHSEDLPGMNLIDMGIPLSAELYAGPGDVAIATSARSLYSNKYAHGTVLIVAGSHEYIGAPSLVALSAQNALAALRSGAGYVTVATTKAARSIVAGISPILVTKEISDGPLTDADVHTITTTKHDTLVLGPGLSEDALTYEAMAKIAKFEKEMKNTIVIDATAIHSFKRFKNLLDRNMVITPHDGEFKALTNRNVKDYPLEKRARAAIEFAKSHSCTIALKGHYTIITDGDLLKINRSLSPVLATMGTGDVLDGIISAFAAAHRNIFESTTAAVYTHSKIADLLAIEKGLHVTAQDIIDNIPNALKLFDRIG
jgi:NAD(P)H-hydrate epimerase